MFIQVIHEIADAQRWNQLAAEFEKQGTPPGFTLHTSVTAADRSRAFCLWEGKSIQTLSEILDPLTEPAAHNRYYEIAAQAPATVLPRVVAPA